MRLLRLVRSWLVPAAITPPSLHVTARSSTCSVTAIRASCAPIARSASCTLTARTGATS